VVTKVGLVARSLKLVLGWVTTKKDRVTDRHFSDTDYGCKINQTKNYSIGCSSVVEEL